MRFWINRSRDRGNRSGTGESGYKGDKGFQGQWTKREAGREEERIKDSRDE